MTDKSITDSSKTQTYSTGRDKTQVYGSEAAATQVYGQRGHAQSVIPETQTYESQESPLIDKTRAHNLGIGDSVELNKKEYEITDVISSEGQTAEAIIYKIKDSQSKIFALKLYYEFRNPKNEPNAEALRRIREIKDPDILHLHDFGTGGNKYQNKFCFEICDFAEGGDLLSVEDIKEKYTPEFLEANVVPEISKGIKRLHQHRIYHCDLNPRNVFFLDDKQKDLVIGDYGSAKTFEQDSEKSLARSSMTKGTDFYLAPEQPRGIISEKNDYYSFGMSLLHLLYPEHLTKANFDKIIERQFAGREIINFDPIYDRINKLIAGLTLQDINRRWGKAEVEDWLDGEDIEVRYPSESAVAPIKLGKVTIRTEGDLVKHIEGDDKWFDDLIDDEVGYGLLLTWLSNLQDFERRKTFDRMVRYYRLNVGGEEYTRKYVKEAVLRFFNPERPVQVEMRSYDFFATDNLLQLVDQFWKHIDDIWKITDLQELKYYLFQFEFSLKQLEQGAPSNLRAQIRSLLDKISAVLDISPKSDFFDYHTVFYPSLTDERLIELFYTFNSKRSFRDFSRQSYETLEDVGRFFTENQELFSDRYMQLEKARFLEKHNLNSLSELKHKDFIFSASVRTEADLNHYIECNDNWYHELFEKSENYTFFLNWLRDIQGNESQKKFREMVGYYRRGISWESEEQYRREAAREAILRFFDPRQPMQVESEEYNFFEAENFFQLVDKFWKHLDDIWKNTDLRQLRYYIFQFEFCIRQLHQDSLNCLKAQVKAVLDKISAILHVANKQRFSDYKVVFPQKITFESLIELFYAFDTHRTFRDLFGDAYRTLEEVGHYFAKNRGTFITNKYMQIERNKFLQRCDRSNLCHLKYEDFLFAVFDEHVLTEICFGGIYFTNFGWTISYKFRRSLAGYFREQSYIGSIIGSFEETQPGESKVKRKIIASYSTIFDDFIANLEKQYNIDEFTISSESKEQFKKDLKQNKRRYIRERYSRKLFAIRAATYILPCYMLVLFAIAFSFKHNQIGDVLYTIIPLKIDWDIGHYTELVHNYGVNVLMLLSLIPAVTAIALTLGLDKFSKNRSLGKVLGSLILYLTVGPFILTAFGHSLNFLLDFLGGHTKWFVDFSEDISVFISTLYLASGPLMVLFVVIEFFSLDEKNCGVLSLLLVSCFYVYLSTFLFRFDFISAKTTGEVQSKVITNSTSGSLFKQGTISVSTANIRTRPSTKARKVDTLHRGEKVSILSVEGNWYRISMPDSREGYIYKKLVSLGGTTSVPLLGDSFSEENQLKELNTWRDSVTGMEFVWVSGGCYEMGCGISTDSCGSNEKPAHEVCVDGFWMGRYEVTQGQWKKVMGYNPSYFKKGNKHPVENVSWHEIKRFIKRFNSKNNKYNFRLPTEAEWEYACKKGGRENRNRHHPGHHFAVGGSKPNSLVLYDMRGNVLEWCEDWYDENYYKHSTKNNPRGPDSGKTRVVRGGCFNVNPGEQWCTERFSYTPDDRVYHLGLRLLRTNKSEN